MMIPIFLLSVDSIKRWMENLNRAYPTWQSPVYCFVIFGGSLRNFPVPRAHAPARRA